MTSYDVIKSAILDFTVFHRNFRTLGSGLYRDCPWAPGSPAKKRIRTPVKKLLGSGSGLKGPLFALIPCLIKRNIYSSLDILLSIVTAAVRFWYYHRKWSFFLELWSRWKNLGFLRATHSGFTELCADVNPLFSLPSGDCKLNTWMFKFLQTQKFLYGKNEKKKNEFSVLFNSDMSRNAR